MGLVLPSAGWDPHPGHPRALCCPSAAFPQQEQPLEQEMPLRRGGGSGGLKAAEEIP